MRVRIGLAGVDLDKATDWYYFNYTKTKSVCINFGNYSREFRIDSGSDDKEKMEFKWLVHKLEEMFPTPKEIDEQEEKHKNEWREVAERAKKYLDEPATLAARLYKAEENMRTEGEGVHNQSDC